MRQTVTGRFRTWNEARHAQDLLMLRGFAPDDIELPVRAHGLLEGVERVISSFFGGDPRGRAARPVQTAPVSPDEPVVIGVHVEDEVHAGLARETLREEQALDIVTHGAGPGWPSDDPAAREHSALEELGLASVAEAIRQRMSGTYAGRASVPVDEGDGVAGSATVGSATVGSATVGSATVGSATVGSAAAGAGLEPLTAAELTAAEPLDASALVSPHIEVPSAPEAIRPAEDAAPQIPDEFLEYEDDTPLHPRTLH